MRNLICLLAAIIVSGCMKAADDRTPASPNAKKRISDEEYGRLINASDEILTRRLFQSQLGVCHATAESGTKIDCSDHTVYVIYLADQARYYPSMKLGAPEPSDYVCVENLTTLVRQALAQGFCFFNSTTPVK